MSNSRIYSTHTDYILLGVCILKHKENLLKLVCVCACMLSHQVLLGSSVHAIFQARVAYHFLFQGIFLTEGLNLCLLRLLHRQADSLPLSQQGSPEEAFHGWWHCDFKVMKLDQTPVASLPRCVIFIVLGPRLAHVWNGSETSIYLADTW